MDHTTAWSQSIDTAGVFAQLDGIGGSADLRDSASNPYYKRDWWLYGFYLQSATISRGRLWQPSYRIIRFPEIKPVSAGAAPPNDPNVMDLRGLEMYIKALDSLELDVIETAAGAEQVTGVAFLTDRQGSVALPDPLNVDRGTYVLHGISTEAAVAFTWSGINTITWDQNPPEGLYQLQGLIVQSTTGIAARVVLPGNVNYRPGSLSVTARGNRSHPMFFDDPRDLGHFESYALPTFEVLCGAADASHDIWIKINRVGDATRPYMSMAP